MQQDKTITNPVVIMLNKVLSEMESLVLDPRVTLEMVDSFGVEKKVIPNQFGLRIDYITLECPSIYKGAKLLKMLMQHFPSSPVYAINDASNPCKLYTKDNKPLSPSEREELVDPIFVGMFSYTNRDKVKIHVPGCLADKIVSLILGGFLKEKQQPAESCSICAFTGFASLSSRLLFIPFS